jgi:hypothetical protein
MNAIIFLAMTVLLPAADLIRNCQMADPIGAILQSLSSFGHSIDPSKVGFMCGIGIVLILLLAANWLFFKATCWAIKKLTQWVGEDATGVIFLFCLVICPMISKLIH